MYGPYVGYSPAGYGFGYQYPMQPYQQPMQPMQPTQQDEIQGVRFVDGLEDAQRCVTPFGSKVLLMDKNSDKFYIKDTDITGVATVSEYEFRKVTNEAQNSDYVTREELEARISQLMNGGASHESTVEQPKQNSGW